MPKAETDIEKLRHFPELILAELSTLTGEPIGTLKFWAAQGLLPYRQIGKRGYRRFPTQDSIERVKKIRELQEVQRRTLPEIKEQLGQAEQKQDAPLSAVKMEIRRNINRFKMAAPAEGERLTLTVEVPADFITLAKADGIDPAELAGRLAANLVRLTKETR